jgi:predicted GIY-YIG superfamily endonuclease
MHYVYKVLDNSVLEYIGVTKNPKQRSVAHSCYPEFNREFIVLHEFKERWMALAKEKELITEMKPPKNSPQGRKKLEDNQKVVSVTLYIKGCVIDDYGGIDTLKENIYKFLEK